MPDTLIHLRCDVVGRAGVLTLDRPASLNALNARLRAEFIAACRQIGSQPDVGAVVITGTGDKAFCAGADIKEAADHSAVDARAIRQEFLALHAAMAALEKPIIGAVNGLCLGAGLELALVCDIRIAAHHARFGLPEIKIGTIPGGGGTVRLQRLIGRGPARALCLTGETISAERAATLGLVTEVVPFRELAARAIELAGDLASHSRTAMRALRASLDRTAGIPLEAALAIEGDIVADLYASADRLEGARAFVEKRPPKFGGRQAAGREPNC